MSDSTERYEVCSICGNSNIDSPTDICENCQEFGDETTLDD